MKQNNLGQSLFFKIILGLAGLSLLIYIIFFGFVLMFFVLLIIWGVLLISWWYKFMLLKYGYYWLIGITMMGVSISLIFYSISGGTRDSLDQNSQDIKINIEEMRHYDGKTYKINTQDNKMKGNIVLKYDDTDGNSSLIASYVFLINDKLDANGVCCIDENPNDMGCVGDYNYEYATKIGDNNKYGNGELMIAYCNQGKLPALGIDASSIYSRDVCDADTTNNIPSEWFYAQFSETYYNVEDFLSANVFSLYDSAGFCDVMEATKDSFSRYLDTDLAVEKGDLVREYVFELVEQY